MGDPGPAFDDGSTTAIRSMFNQSIEYFEKNPIIKMYKPGVTIVEGAVPRDLVLQCVHTAHPTIRAVAAPQAKVASSLY